MDTAVKIRETKYCAAIRSSLRDLGHASNAELLSLLRKNYPELSATTIHRATARLAARGEIGVAPNTKEGAMQYDANVAYHDHFQCNNCGVLKDVQLSKSILPFIEEKIGDGCKITGNIVVNGTCKHCAKARSF